MLFLPFSLRAPADVRQQEFQQKITSLSLSRGLRNVCVMTADAFFGCRHKNIALPYHNNQTCLECGSVRSYYFLDGADPSHTVHIGPWRSTIIVRQTVQQILPAMLEVRTATVRG